MPEQNSGENDVLLHELGSVSLERDKHLQAAERLRIIRDELIAKAFRTNIPRKTIAAASLLKEISLYKMMARRAEAARTEPDEEPEPDLFSDVEDEIVEVVDAYGTIREIHVPEFKEAL